MKNFTFLFLLLGTLISAQNQRFIYEYKFVTDSTRRDVAQSELIVLDVDAEGSKFYSYEKYKADSVTSAEVSKQVATKSNDILVKNTYNGSIRYSITKNYPDFKTVMKTSVAGDDYNVWDEREIEWKILPETETVATFKAQKAEAKMFGRIWTAWFTNEIPIQDGPYKFRGLPGLIVKLQDKTLSHSFEIKSVRNIVPQTEFKSAFIEKPIDVDYSKYKKIFWENRKDPAKSLRLMINENPTFKIVKNGEEVSGEQMVREREKSAKEAQKKNNNPLELDLLKE